MDNACSACAREGNFCGGYHADGGACSCTHVERDHPTLAALTRQPPLRARGPNPQNPNCPGYSTTVDNATPSTPCSHCNAPWWSHAELPTPNRTISFQTNSALPGPSPRVSVQRNPAAANSATLWEAPVATPGSSNDRREASAARVRPTLSNQSAWTASGSASARQPRHSHPATPGGGRGGRQVASGRVGVDRFTIAVVTQSPVEAASSQAPTTPFYDETELGYPIRIQDIKLRTVYNTLNNHQLTSTVTIDRRLATSEIFSVFGTNINAVLERSGTVFPPSPDPLDTSVLWCVLAPGQDPRDNGGRGGRIYKCNKALNSQQQWKLSTLRSLGSRGENLQISDHPLLWIARIFCGATELSFEALPVIEHLTSCPIEGSASSSAQISSDVRIERPTNTTDSLHLLQQMPSDTPNRVLREALVHVPALARVPGMDQVINAIVSSSTAGVRRPRSESSENIQSTLHASNRQRTGSPIPHADDTSEIIHESAAQDSTFHRTLMPLLLQALWYGESSVQLPPDVDLGSITHLYDLLRPEATQITLQRGIGPGVVRDFFCTVMELMLEDPLWALVSSSEPRFFSLFFDYPPTPLRLAKLKAYGTVIAMFLIRYRVLHSSLSPALFIALFKGADAILDLHAIELYDPGRAAILAGWPESPNDSMSTGMTAVVADVLNRQPSDIQALDYEDRQYQKGRIYRNVLLKVDSGMTADTFNEHPYTKALSAGLDISLGNGNSFMKAFGLTASDLIATEFSGNRITSVDDVWPLINFEDGDNPRYEPAENQFMNQLRRYFGGQGYPKCPAIDEMFTEEQRVAVELADTDKLFRIRGFIKVVTGLVILPSDPVVVTFRRTATPLVRADATLTRAERYEAARQRGLPNFVIAACSNTIRVPLSNSIIAMMDYSEEQSEANPNIGTVFDTHLFQAIGSLPGGAVRRFLESAFPDLLDELHAINVVSPDLSATYRLYRQYRLIVRVCSTLGLHVDRPSTRTMVEWNNTAFMIGVNDVVQWMGRSTGSFANRRRLMKGLHTALAFLQFQSLNGNLVGDIQVRAYHDLQAFTIPYDFALDSELAELPESIRGWTMNTLKWRIQLSPNPKAVLLDPPLKRTTKNESSLKFRHTPVDFMMLVCWHRTPPRRRSPGVCLASVSVLSWILALKRRRHATFERTTYKRLEEHER
ncbi:hypothetical protein BDZ89DRAFT_1120591 [Hymenopellis radicata]|nr:hypothetical protein BDZ89DRAFT_1120591 [Hymenopellis radicata]